MFAQKRLLKIRTSNLCDDYDKEHTTLPPKDHNQHAQPLTSPNPDSSLNKSASNHFDPQLLAPSAPFCSYKEMIKISNKMIE